MYVCMYIQTYTYAHIHTYTHTHIHIYNHEKSKQWNRNHCNTIINKRHTGNNNSDNNS